MVLHDKESGSAGCWLCATGNDRRGYRGRARTMAQMVPTGHLPGSLDEVGVLGLVEDGVLDFDTAVNQPRHYMVRMQDLRVQFPKASPRLVTFRRIDWAADPLACGGYTFVHPGGTGACTRLAAADAGALFWAGSAGKR